MVTIMIVRGKNVMACQTSLEVLRQSLAYRSPQNTAVTQSQVRNSESEKARPTNWQNKTFLLSHYSREQNSLGICTRRNKTTVVFSFPQEHQGIVVRKRRKKRKRKVKRERKLAIPLKLKPQCHALPSIRHGESGKAPSRVRSPLAGQQTLK